MSEEAPTLGEALVSEVVEKSVSTSLMDSLVNTPDEERSMFEVDQEDCENECKPDLWMCGESNVFRCVLCCEPCSSWDFESEMRMEYLFTLAELISDNPTDLGEGLFKFSYCDSCQEIISSLYRNIAKVSKLEAKIKFLKSQIVSHIEKDIAAREDKWISGSGQHDAFMIQNFLSFRKKLREDTTGHPRAGRKPRKYGHQKRLKVYTTRVRYVPEGANHKKEEVDLEDASDRESSYDPGMLPDSDSESNMLGLKNASTKKKLSKRKKSQNAVAKIPCSQINCNQTFAKEEAMLIHVKKVHEGIQNPYKCDLCDKSYSCRSRLNEHKQMHEKGQEFVCEQCGKTFSGKTLLRNHKRCHNKVRREFKCDLCPKVYGTKQALQKHSIIVHTKNYPFHCDICGIGFAIKSQLKYHVGHHFEDDPLKCKDCGKTYGTPKDLRYHRQKHTGEYPIHCKICNKGMTTPTDLKRHMDVHNDRRDYKCDLCQKGFRSMRQMQIHRRIHTNDRQHLCDVCGKGFYNRTTLRAHQRIHTGEQPYQCHICHKRFMHDHYIKKHLAYHEKAASEGRMLKVKPNFHRKDTIAPGITKAVQYSDQPASEFNEDNGKASVDVNPCGELYNLPSASMYLPHIK